MKTISRYFLIACSLILMSWFSEISGASRSIDRSQLNYLHLPVILKNYLTPVNPPNCADIHSAPPTAALELYGTFESMGITATVAEADHPSAAATTLVEYRTPGEPFHAGFPLTRLNDTRFVGSLFWLTPGDEYEVRVTFYDPQTAWNCAVLAGGMSTRADLPVLPSPVHTYIASPAGVGDSCTLAEPCHVQTGLSKTGPGDVLMLRGGVYYTGQVSAQNSGQVDAPLVIRSYPGEQAILDGAEPGTIQWNLYQPGIYTHTVSDPGLNLVFANNERLYPYKNLDELTSLRWGLPGYYLDGSTLYIHLLGGADPNAVPVAISRYPHALWIAGNHTYIVDLQFRHYSEDRYQQGAVHLAGSENVVMDSSFTNTHSGIAIEPGAHKNVIQDNTFSDTMFEFPWDAVYDGTHLPSQGGIRFMGPDTSRVSRGNVIRRNVFHDTFDGMHICPDQAAGNTSNETDVYENTIYRAADDGIETDGACENVRIWKNTIHDVLAGVSLAPARGGPTYVLRNLIYRTGATRYCPFRELDTSLPCGGNPFKFEWGDPESGYMYLLHNTTDSFPGSPGLRIAGNNGWPLLYSRNNTYIGRNREALKYELTVDQPLDFDYDLLMMYNHSAVVVWNGTKIPDLNQFQQASGLELHGLSVDPGFLNPDGGEYALTPSSPLIDAGLYLPGINDGYHGSAPDIGFLEWSGH